MFIQIIEVLAYTIYYFNCFGIIGFIKIMHYKLVYFLKQNKYKYIYKKLEKKHRNYYNTITLKTYKKVSYKIIIKKDVNSSIFRPYL